jgi:excisionase family DNA binding protein
MNDDDDLLRPGEAARRLGVSLDTLRRWDRAGKLRCVRTLGNQRRVPMSEVKRILERNEPTRPK